MASQSNKNRVRTTQSRTLQRSTSVGGLESIRRLPSPSRALTRNLSRSREDLTSSNVRSFKRSCSQSREDLLPTHRSWSRENLASYHKCARSTTPDGMNRVVKRKRLSDVEDKGLKRLRRPASSLGLPAIVNCELGSPKNDGNYFELSKCARENNQVVASSSRSSSPESVRSEQFSPYPKAKMRKLTKKRRLEMFQMAKLNPLTDRGSTQPLEPMTPCLEDRFCWSCHRDGKQMLPCSACPRVFHLRCTKLMVLPKKEDSWVCHICRQILDAERSDKRDGRIPLKQLCHLFTYVIQSMKDCEGSEPFWRAVDTEVHKFYRCYIAYPMDLTLLGEKVRKKSYGSTEAFEADAKWILHNCIVFNTPQHDLTTVAKKLMRVCTAAMHTIESCPDCYLRSFSEPDNYFTSVCPRPHLPIWAKLKGFPYWPAKVMRMRGEEVEVRFFGDHDRSYIQLKDCFLLSKTSPTINHSKKAFDKLRDAMDEVQLYIENLEEVYGEFRYAEIRIPFNPDKMVEHLQACIPGYRSNTHGQNGELKNENSVIDKTDSGASTQRTLSKTVTMTHMPTRDVRVPALMNLEQLAAVMDSTNRCPPEDEEESSTDAEKEMSPSSPEPAVRSVSVSAWDEFIKVMATSDGYTEEYEDAYPVSDEESAGHEDSCIRRRGSLDTSKDSLLETSESGRTDGDDSPTDAIERVSCNDITKKTVTNPQKRAKLKPISSLTNPVNNCDKYSHLLTPQNNRTSLVNNNSKTNTASSVNDESNDSGATFSSEGVTKINMEETNVPKLKKISSTNRGAMKNSTSSETCTVLECEYRQVSTHSVGITRSSSTEENSDDSMRLTISEVPLTNECEKQLDCDANTGFSKKDIPQKKNNSLKQTKKTVQKTSEMENTQSKPALKSIAVYKDKNIIIVTPSDGTVSNVMPPVDVDDAYSLMPDPNAVDPLATDGEAVDPLHIDVGNQSLRQQSGLCIVKVKPTVSGTVPRVCVISSDNIRSAANKNSRLQNILKRKPLNFKDSDKEIAYPVVDLTNEMSECSMVDRSSSLNHSYTVPTVQTKNRPVSETSKKSVTKMLENTVYVNSNSTSQSSAGIQVESPTTILDPKTGEWRSVYRSQEGNSLASPKDKRVESRPSLYHGSGSITTRVLNISDSSQKNDQAFPKRNLGPTINLSKTISLSVVKNNKTPASDAGPVSGDRGFQQNMLGRQTARKSLASPNTTSKLLKNTVTDRAEGGGDIPHSDQPSEFVSGNNMPMVTFPPACLNSVGPLNLLQAQVNGRPVTAGLSLPDGWAESLQQQIMQLIYQAVKELAGQDPRAAVASLRLELDRQAQRHQQKLNELEHNFTLSMKEVHASYKSTWEEERKALTKKHQELQRLSNRRVRELEQTLVMAKKKQWCSSCGEEAQLYCCWNTSYCNYACQDAHWKEHMDVCRQKEQKVDPEGPEVISSDISPISLNPSMLYQDSSTSTTSEPAIRVISPVISRPQSPRFITTTPGRLGPSHVQLPHQSFMSIRHPSQLVVSRPPHQVSPPCTPETTVTNQAEKPGSKCFISIGSKTVAGNLKLMSNNSNNNGIHNLPSVVTPKNHIQVQGEMQERLMKKS